MRTWERKEAMLEITDFHYYYGHVHALKGINLTVSQGQIVALIGANGAGKTTTLRCISGILRSRQGQIVFSGENICGRRQHRIAKKGITQVLEGRRLFAHLTVLENLQMGAYLRSDTDGIKADIDKMFELFPRLRERTNQNAGTLSGGEQQMLAMARALMSRPKLLLLDEPSLGLAPIFIDSIFEVIKKIAGDGATILLVEQNARLALEISDRGYVMELGKIVTTDDSRNLLNNDIVKKSYLGQNQE